MTAGNSTFLERLASRRRFGVRPGLETIRALMSALGNPQETLRCVHIAGTNGKGATAAMLESILRAAGCSTARYTSPHLVSIAERFFLNGMPTRSEVLDAVADEVFPAVERLEREKGLEITFFEALTAVAFVLFARARPDVVVLEAGLGGRLDATNVIERPLVSVITRIGLDHCDWLGRTHAAIAEEKAGIVKPGRPVVCGAMPNEALEVVKRIASVRGAPLMVAPAWKPPAGFALFGGFQEENAATVKAVVDVLRGGVSGARGDFFVPDDAIARGLSSVVWPGRCQRIERDGVTFVVDGAHNPDAAAALVAALREMRLPGPVGLVAGFCGDKDADGHLAMMSSVVTRGWSVPIRNSRSLAAGIVAAKMRAAGIHGAAECATLRSALDEAAAWARGRAGSVVVCGSLFLAGEALVELGAYPWPFVQPDDNEPMPMSPAH